MKQLKCLRKGIKLAQEKDCDCTTFALYLDKANQIHAKCTKCGTTFNESKLKN